jgi:hypothetical protein
MSQSESDTSPRFMLPIFAVGGTVSGYASMGSAESLADKTREKLVVTRPDVVREAVEKVRGHGQEQFKSKFAKELNDQSLTVENKKVQHVLKKPIFAKRHISVINQIGDVPVNVTNENAKSDLIRLKLENEQLKLKIQKCLVEDERYRHLQHEVEQLRHKFSQVIEHFLLDRMCNTKIFIYTHQPQKDIIHNRSRSRLFILRK